MVFLFDDDWFGGVCVCVRVRSMGGVGTRRRRRVCKHQNIYLDAQRAHQRLRRVVLGLIVVDALAAQLVLDEPARVGTLLLLVRRERVGAAAACVKPAARRPHSQSDPISSFSMRF